MLGQINLGLGSRKLIDSQTVQKSNAPNRTAKTTKNLKLA
jgi:hypothetical protein